MVFFQLVVEALRKNFHHPCILALLFINIAKKVTQDQEAVYSRTTEDITSKSRDEREQRKEIRFLPVFLVSLIAIGIITGGFFLYTNYFQKQTVQQDPAIELTQPVQQQVAKDDQIYNNQISSKTPDKTLSSPSPKQAEKPAHTQVYSVQIGAFKSEANAKTLSLRYKKNQANKSLARSRRTESHNQRTLVA